jgi:HSP20 family protein
MSLVRFHPWSELSGLQRQMNRLFEDYFTPSWTETEGLIHAPAAEISETPEAVHLKLEVPGMEAKDLDINVTKDSVSITGERKQESKTEEGGVTRTEFRYGKFQRVIPLPARVENTNVVAEYNNGILTLVLPKAEEEKNKVVKVNIG